MGKGEFFSFGDEDLEGAVADPWSTTDLPDRSGAVGLADLPQEVAESGPHDADAEKRAQRSRGDSETRSSEKREPSSLRLHGTVALALMVAAVLLVHIVLAATAGDRGSAVPPPTVSATAIQAAREQAALEERAQARRAQVKREHAAERQRTKRRRTLIRKRARRRRRSHLANRHRRADHRRSEIAAAPPPSTPAPAPAPTYVAPIPATTEPPPSAPPSAPSPPRGPRDGSSSPEFGL